jgi:hypothetical protein
MVSSGKGDLGGKSYGAFQLSSKTGDVDKFLKSSGYAKQFEGMKVGDKDFDDKWKDLGKNDPAFAKAQSAHAQKTHYDPQVEKLKSSGMDLSGRGAGVQEAIMSTANQYGAKTDVIIKALKDKDVGKMSDKDIINAVQDYKANTVETRFKSSSVGVRAGVAKRIEQERAALLNVGDEKLATTGSDKAKGTDKEKVGDKKPEEKKEVGDKKPEEKKEATAKITIRGADGKDRAMGEGTSMDDLRKKADEREAALKASTVKAEAVASTGLAISQDTKARDASALQLRDAQAQAQIKTKQTDQQAATGLSGLGVNVGPDAPRKNVDIGSIVKPAVDTGAANMQQQKAYMDSQKKDDKPTGAATESKPAGGGQDINTLLSKLVSNSDKQLELHASSIDHARELIGLQSDQKSLTRDLLKASR